MTKRGPMRMIASLALGAVTLALSASAAEADVTIAVSPSLQEFAVDPGASFTQLIHVSNEGSDPAQLSVGVGEYQGRSDISAVDWLRAQPDEFELGPGDSADIAVHVSVPPDAEPGGRFETVHIRTSPVSLAGGADGFVGGTGVGARIESVFLLTVRGPALKLEGQLTKVVPVAMGPSRLGTRVEITNTGNVHIFPEGEVELKDEEGNVVGRFTLPQTMAILPGETKSFYLKGVEDVPAGDYQAAGTVEYGWNEEQINAAQVDPERWTEQETTREISFNSVPKLRVVEVELEGSGEKGAQLTLVLENYGDVEVSPVGFIDVLSRDGDRGSLVNIGSGSWPLEPHSTATREYVYNDILPKGEYEVAAQLNYHGEDTAAKTATVVVEQDIVPPVAPQAPQARRMHYSPGTPGWVWAALAGAGAMAAMALVTAGWAVRRSATPRTIGPDCPYE